MFVVINFLVDVIYTLLDPRVRLAGAGGLKAWMRSSTSRSRDPQPAEAHAWLARISREPHRRCALGSSCC